MRDPGGSGPPEGKRQYIIVVDDNVGAADMLAQLLEAVGYPASAVYTGAQALEQAARRQPTAMILDIGLPDMSGLDLARKIRATAWGAQIPLLALSGFGTDKNIADSLAAGMNRHFLKPMSITTLKDVLDEYLH